ncbi:MAG: prepilin-type N-terminal cleavage/methylation domain-containing protein [Phycisphaera sp.]|nr:prepilin-type N-terminal cleavage/methylation domain-containing protein [Phycisphaera sp.]
MNIVITRHRTRGFTLTELMVAVVVLLVIILAVGRIFGTASTVVANGEGNASILQEAAALESLMRGDLQGISDEGVLMVQCVAVRNNVMTNFQGGGQLLDPKLPPGQWLRCDQLFFITEDLAISRQTRGMNRFRESPTGFYSSLGGLHGPVPQSTGSILYYGHGFQLPFAPPGPDPLDLRQPLDNNIGLEFMQPWYRPGPGTFERLDLWPQGNAAGRTNPSQPAADQWALARQELLMAEDGDDFDEHYLGIGGSPSGKNASGRLSDDPDGDGVPNFLGPSARASRVDVVTTDASRFQDFIRRLEGGTGDPAVAGAALSDLLFDYRPRAEKRPPSLSREDALLTANTLLGNCSSFSIDWTWADGVGRELDVDPITGLQGVFRGMSTRGGSRPSVLGEGGGGIVQDLDVETPWYGLDQGNPSPRVRAAFDFDDDEAPHNERFHPPLSYADTNVGPTSTPSDTPGGAAVTYVPRVGECIEGAYEPFEGVLVYRAYFGLNGDEPFVRDRGGRPLTLPGSNAPLLRGDYTPWPSALRITATVHDAKGTIEGGRSIQFTLPLPRRVQDLPEGGS